MCAGYVPKDDFEIFAFKVPGYTVITGKMQILKNYN